MNLLATTAVSKFKSKFTSFKVKVEPRSEAFLLDNTNQWDASSHVSRSLLPSKDLVLNLVFSRSG